MTHTQILIAECIAAVAYAAVFMIVFDKIMALTERQVAQTEPAAPAAEAPVSTPVAQRTLRGLAAEPSVLPRTMSGLPRSGGDAAALPGLIASLDKVPSRPSRVAAAA